MKCRLCDKEELLKESHIIPKFVFRWLKETGGKYIRKADNPNKRVEDGVKLQLFCNNCEQLFSKVEDKFARDIFYPYSNSNIYKFQYDEDLLKFSVSVLFRILLVNIDRYQLCDYPHVNELKQAQNEWKDFLLSNTNLEQFNKIHIFFTTNKLNNNTLPVENFLNYYSRAVDGTIVFNNKTCFIYAKLARIIIVGEIKQFNNTNMFNTLINKNGGEISTNTMQINVQFKEYIISRVGEINLNLNKVSDKQKNIAISNTKIHINNPLYSDISKVIAFESNAVIDKNLKDFK
jgi:hypothetical protein